MIELLAALGGGLLRLAPEVLKWLDRKDERKHELEMLDRSNKQALDIENARGLTMMDEGAMNAFVEAVKSAGTPTGVRWVDALNASVRGAITYWLLLLYSAAKGASFWLAVQASTPALVALAAVYTEADAGLFSGVISFWFVGRVWDRYVPRR